MYEIYYTSAPSGLKRGTSGFCTVAATDGIPKPLLERLESLSAYRHHFAQGDGQVNPVSFGHYRLAAQGKEYHVLSRVCDSGVDHTHRTNAFAHHLALDKSELLLEGPAALLQTPRLMVAQWDSAVGPLSRASLPGAIETIPGPCTAWQALAGDAGYAGLLLESAIKSPTKPVCILFSPGQDMLPLIAEVLRLVPTPLRWAITFNTYFTSMPSSATCTWRCCLAKTPAADAALRAASTGGIVLNLADRAKLPPLPGAGKNPYIESARDGMPLATKAKAKVGAAPQEARRERQWRRRHGRRESAAQSRIRHRRCHRGNRRRNRPRRPAVRHHPPAAAEFSPLERHVGLPPTRSVYSAQVAGLRPAHRRVRRAF